jgi:WD40 repeat protein
MAISVEPVEKARSGVRSWIRSAGSGLRRASPYGIVAFLAASAVAPVAGAALGAPAEYAAALNQLGGMGSNYLSDTLMAAAGRVRDGHPSEADWRDAVAGELLTRLEAGDTALRAEVAELLHAVDAVDVALRAADERGRQQLAEAFTTLGGLAGDTADALAAIQQQLAEHARTQRVHTDLVRQSLVGIAQLRQAVLGHPDGGTGTPPPDAPAPAGATPYPGLAGFSPLDAPYFRGREALVAECLGRLSDQLLGGPPLVVVGVSGAGKSSLLHAGVLPAVADGALGEDTAGWPWLIMTPGATPLAEFTERAAVLGTDRFVVLVDQFEELFAQCAEPAERTAFVEALAAARPALLIIAVRADFYAQCTELPPMVPMLGAGQLVVGRLGTGDLRRAITEPAREAGLAVEPGLADLLLADLGAPDHEPGALPLLAHALRATWERRDGSTLTVEGYRRTGGIRRAVASTAEQVYRGLHETGQAALRTAMLGMVTIVDDVPVRRRSQRSEADLTVLQPMIAARLVTAAEHTVEISHDALLTGWPRLAGWLVEAREEILLRQRLAQAAAEWSAAGEDPDALYGGARLAAAREWAAGRDNVPDAQRRFLAASEAAAHERELAQRRTTRRLRRLVAGLAVALLLAVAGGLVALDQRADAKRNANVALSRQRAAESLNEHFADPLGSAVKALDAWSVARTSEARSALTRAEHTGVLGRLGTEPGATAVAVSPDGRLVAVGYLNGRIRLWDSHTLQPAGLEFRQPSGRAAPLAALAFSPDGRYLAAGSLMPDGVHIWDVPGGTLRRTLPGAGAPAWLPDSSAVLATRFDTNPAGHAVGAWNPVTGRLIAVVRTPVVAVAGQLAVSPDGTHVALHGVGGTEVVRRSDGRSTPLDRTTVALGFAGNGTLFGAGDDGKVRAYDPAAGWKPTVLNPAEWEKSANRIVVTRDGTVIVGAAGPDVLQRFTVGGPRIPVDGFRGVPSDLALSADDRLLAVTSPTGPPQLFRLYPSELPHPQVARYLAFSRTGDRLATGSHDPAIRIWDPRTGRLLSTIATGGDDGPLGLAYAPDGSLASVFGAGRVLIHGPDGRLRATLRVADELYPAAPAFSPDGSTLSVVTAWREPPDAGSREAQERRDPDLYVWDARTLELRGQIRVPHEEGISQAYTPDGRHLLIGANRTRGGVKEEGRPIAGVAQDGAVWRYRTADLGLVDRRDLAGAAVDEMAVSPDGALVAVARGDGAQLLRVDGLAPAGERGPHPEQVNRVAWSPDGRLLATASDSDNDVIRLWDAGGREVLQMRSNSNQDGQVAFSPAGGILAAGTNDWTVSLWQLDPADAIERLCAFVAPAVRAAGDPVPEECRSSPRPAR